MSNITQINNLKELLNNTISRHSDRTAFKFKGKDSEIVEVKYSTFKLDIDGLGTALIDLGLKDKKIIIIAENRYEWAVSYFAVTCGVGIAVPLDRSLPENEVRDLIVASDADAIICSDKYIDGVKKIIGHENCKLQVFINMDDSGMDFLSFRETINKGRDLISNGNMEFLNAEIDEVGLGVFIFTSGTTSLSKAVMLSHKNICSNIMDVLAVENLYETDVTLSFLPMHHTFECTIGLLSIICVGGCISFCEGIRHISKNLKEFQVTVMIGVPILFESMYKKLWETIRSKGKESTVKTALRISNLLRNVFKIDIAKKLFKDIHAGLGGKVRLFVSGAAAIDPDVLRGFTGFGIEMLQGYGLTETSPVLTAEGNLGKRAGSCGKPMPSVEIKIDKPDENGIGEIIAKGPNIMLGYYKNEEATKEVLKDGWFYTGDLGYLDKDGFLFITGRKKNVIVLKNGKKIFPEEVETLLNREDYITESFVFGTPTEDDDVEIGTKIVYNREALAQRYGEKDEKEIYSIIWDYVKSVNKEMPKYKYIKNLLITEEELIKTTTKKIKRHEELKLVLEQLNR
jgi:long-chain acyl-CoA synthetase